MSKKERTSLGRRDFFKKAGIGAGAVGAVAVGLAPKAKADDLAKTSPTSAGYRETEHVKKYYELSRF